MSRTWLVLRACLSPTSQSSVMTVHVDRVPHYFIAIRSDGFDVEFISAEGDSQIIRGFKTMADAHACILNNRLLTDAVDQ